MFNIINSQQCNLRMLGINEMAQAPCAWDIPNMAKLDKRNDSQRRAAEIARRLAALQPDGLSERQWCIRAGVSSSFFSNLRGTPTKPPSEPSVGNLRAVLTEVGVTLPEFFLDEGEGRVAAISTAQSQSVPSWLSEGSMAYILEGVLPAVSVSLDLEGRAQVLAHVVAEGAALLAENPSKANDQSYLDGVVSAILRALRNYTPLHARAASNS